MFDFLPPDEAIAGATVAVDRALELDPLLARAYYERSRLTADPARRIADLERAAELGLSSADAHFSRSQALLELDRRAEARAALEEAVSLDPRSVPLNWMMGSLRLNLGDRIGARGYYLRTIDLQPTSPNAYAGIGDVETADGRLDEGVRWYMAGLEQDPGQPHIPTWIGFLYLSLNDEARAAVWFERGADLLQGRGSAEELFDDFVPLVWRREDPERLVQLIRGVSPGLFGAFGSRIFRKAILATGISGEIRRYYEDIWPELFLENPTIGNDNFDVVADVVWILRNSGDGEHADSMLDDALAVFNANDWASIYPSDLSSSLPEVEILASMGRTEEALGAMRSGIDTGWRFGWWQLERDPVLESIHDRPEFKAMLDEIRAEMAAQRASMPDYLPPSL
jgi:tetratricopeptide (TPR) repeat protein